MHVITADAVTKIYPQRQGGRALFGRGGLQDLFTRRGREVYAALDEVSLQVEAGESLGIIGSNGSGKSTLLKILAGVTLPTRGEVQVQGRVASLLELGAGFHPMLTGRENVYLNAAINGLTRQQVDARLDDIIAFSGIAEFIDRPVDTYSSGMYVRIAFSVAVHSDPDIFLVDEVLAVGDEAFQRQCRRKMGELREQGKTLIFVSHDLGIVNTLCNRVILLSNGRLLERGTPQQTFDFYLRQIGHGEGIHRLQQRGIEALFSNGKIALYRNAQELTSPEGIHAQVESMGQTQGSTHATWRVTKSTETSLTAEGLMPRVPCRLIFELTFVDSHLTLSLTMVAEQAFNIQSLSLVLSWPIAMDRWAFDGNVLEAAPLTPAHINPEPLALPDSESREVIAFAAGEELPHAAAMVFTAHENAYLHLLNSEYLAGARRLYWSWRPAPGGHLIHANERVTLGPMQLDIFMDAGEARRLARENESLRQCTVPGLRAEMSRGRVTLYEDPGERIGELHALFCIGDLWTNSSFLSATPARRQGEEIKMTSTSRRMPVELHWTMKAEGEDVVVSVAMAAAEPVAVQEYNLSLLVHERYTQWQVPGERGVFPPWKDTPEWDVVNTRYERGSAIILGNDTAPRIAMVHQQDSPLPLASVLNTGTSDRRRVAQWLCRPQGPDAFHFAAGQHHLLTVRLRAIRGAS